MEVYFIEEDIESFLSLVLADRSEDLRNHPVDDASFARPRVGRFRFFRGYGGNFSQRFIWVLLSKVRTCFRGRGSDRNGVADVNRIPHVR